MKCYRYTWILLAVLAFAACKKDEPAPIANVEVKDILIEASYKKADIYWRVEANATAQAVVLEYSTDSAFAAFKQAPMSKVTADQKGNLYQTSLDSLQEDAKYYARSRVVNRLNSYASKPQVFKTKAYGLARVSTDSITDITVFSAKLYGTLIEWGTDTMPQIGFCVATHPNVSMEDSCLIYAGTTDHRTAYMVPLTNLAGETTYYVRTYAVNSKGVSYGEEVSFSTTPYGLPVVTTANVTNISYTTATCGGEVIDDGGLAINERGVCYSTYPNPTITDKKIGSGVGSGKFTCDLSGLKMGVSYYIRAFATNRLGTAYGEELLFSTVSSENSVLYYTATYKLPETANSSSSGLHTNAFDVSIESHDFVDGEGVIMFNGKLQIIGTKAFYGCSGLTTVTIPNSVSEIGMNAFNGCTSLTSITIPNNVTSIGYSAFMHCNSLTSINIPNDLSYIGKQAFYCYSDLISVYINNWDVWYKFALGTHFQNEYNLYFDGELVSEYVLPHNIAYIEDGLFQYCISLTSVTIPYGITSIGSNAFFGCTALTYVTLSNSVTSIGVGAFQGCKSLSSIRIPYSVTSVGGLAFSSCSALTKITCEPTTPPSCGDEPFNGINTSIPLYVPAASVEAYKQATVWKEFKNILPINE